MVTKVTLEISPVTGQKDPSNREFSESSQMVGGSTESYGRCSYPSSCSQHTGIHRCLPKRLGSSLKRDSSQWPSNKEAQLHINVLELKAVLLALKGFQEHLQGQRVLICSDNSTVVSYLNKEGGTHSIEMCALIWRNSGIHKFQKDPDKSKTCTWIPKCDSRLPITKGQGHTNRVVPSPTDIQPNLQSLAHTSGRPVCNSSKSQTSNLCISCPRQKGLKNRCIEYLLGRPRRLYLLSSSHPATSN